MLKKKVGYVSMYDPFNDRRAWSGLIYKVREAIENAGFEVCWIPYNSSNAYTKAVCMIYRIISKIDKKMILFERTRVIGRIFASTIKHTKEFEDCDLFFFCDQSAVLSSFKSTKPKIYYCDAVFDIMVDFYWYNMNKWAVVEGHKVDKKAIDNSTVSIFSSDWAMQAAHEMYNIPMRKLKILEFGANIDESQIKKIKGNRRDNISKLNILFSGIDWERKGGDIAVETTRLLNECGINSTLHVLGINKLPSNVIDKPYIVNHGFFNKNIESEYDKYVDILASCDIMLLPTHAECSATVFCEASAFGIPIYTYDVGGLSNYVINGQNGYRLPQSCSANDFCKKIRCSINKKELGSLSAGGMNLYRERLSWAAWSKRFGDIVKQIYE